MSLGKEWDILQGTDTGSSRPSTQHDLAMPEES